MNDNEPNTNKMREIYNIFKHKLVISERKQTYTMQICAKQTVAFAAQCPIFEQHS